MRYMKNERGGALMMVLLLVLVFTILGMGLLTMNISAAKQFNKKEEQVQARHLAEMGVLYYQANIESAIKKYHEEEFVYEYVRENGVTIIDQDASLKKYYKEVCTAANKVPIEPLYTSSLGTYSLDKEDKEDADCKPTEILSKIVFAVESTGKVGDTEKIIDAEVIISSGEGLEGGGGSTGGSAIGELPNKPTYPEDNWPYKSYTTDLDGIKNSDPARVLNASTSNNPFVTSAFVELVGLDMKKKSNWTFKDHLLISGSAGMHTSGSNLSTLTVNKNYYIGGAFHITNHNKVNVGGDFLVMGNMDFGTKSYLNVGRNALFDGGIMPVQPDANITIQHNAYFKEPLGEVKNKARFCVKGDIFLWKSNAWAPYLPTDAGYGGFAKSCLGTTTGEPFNWVVDSGVNAEYK